MSSPYRRALLSKAESTGANKIVDGRNNSSRLDLNGSDVTNSSALDCLRFRSWTFAWALRLSMCLRVCYRCVMCVAGVCWLNDLFRRDADDIDIVIVIVIAFVLGVIAIVFVFGVEYVELLKPLIINERR